MVSSLKSSGHFRCKERKDHRKRVEEEFPGTLSVKGRDLGEPCQSFGAKELGTSLIGAFEKKIAL